MRVRKRRVAASQAAGHAAGQAATLGSGYGEGWLRRLAAHCWQHKSLTLVAFGASVLATLVTTAIPLIQRDIIDNAILAHKQAIWPGASLLIVAALVSFGCVYLRRYRGGQLSLDVQHDLRTELFGSLTKLDGARQDQLHTGQIVSRSISDLNMIQSLLSMLPMLIGSALLFFASIVVMFLLSPLLALISLAVGPVSAGAVHRIPATAVPGELGCSAEGRRGSGRRRGRGHRRPRGQGLRSGEPGDRAA